MARYESTIEVSASPDAVSAFLSDVANTQAWDPSVVEARRADGPGRGRLVLGFYGRRFELDCVVDRHPPTAAGEAATVVLRATSPKIERCDTFTVTATAGGSRVAFASELRLKGVLRVLGRGLQVPVERMGAQVSERLAAALSS
ncbi:MAG TPA: SRPBCC family protein [Acidimicrobiales bacterium]